MGTPVATRSVTRRASWMLVAPLCASIALGGWVLVLRSLEGTGLDLSWSLLILLGPAIPLYLLLLPMLPFVLRALRRGWDPHPAAILATTFVISGLFDLAFWLGRS